MTDNGSDTKALGFQNNEVHPETPIGDYYLFAVGIDHYDLNNTPGAPPLKNCVRDMAALVDRLVTHYAFDTPDASNRLDLKLKEPKFEADDFPVVEYRDDKVYCLYNENATQDNFTKHLIRLLGDEKPLLKENDCLVLLFSGHGSISALKTFKLALFDQMFDPSEIFPLLDDYYSTKKRCRHFLLILDCCYSGEIIFKNQGIRRDADFSRNILASSQADQKAYDGVGGSRHSPFAESLLDCFSEYKNIDSNILDVRIGGKIREKTNGSQDKIYMALPVNEMGKGHFPFRVKYQRPDPTKVTQKLYDLNFNPQKEAIDFDPNSKGNRFNIVTLKGETEHTQSFVAKILFQEFVYAFQENRKPETHFQQYPFDVGATIPTVLDFWNALIKGLGFEEAGDAIDFILGQLLEKNLVLLCQLAPVGEKEFDLLQIQLKAFLNDLKNAIQAHELYQEKSEEMKYLFLFFKDIQNNDEIFQKDKFEPYDETFNVFLTEKMDGIKAKDFNKWWGECGGFLTETLKMPEINTNAFQRKIGFEEFINELTACFGYSDDDRAKLNQLLFDTNPINSHAQT